MSHRVGEATAQRNRQHDVEAMNPMIGPMARTFFEMPVSTAAICGQRNESGFVCPLKVPTRNAGACSSLLKGSLN
jgi:hypothetical protein